MSPIPRSALFDLSPNAYMLLDRDLVYLDANPAYERVAGRRREQLIGRPLFEMFPGDPLDPRDTSAAELRASLRHVLERREPHHVAFIRYPIPRATPEGTVYEERYWSATHTPVLDADGEVAAILQHTTEVTALHHLREVAGSGPAQLEGGVLARAQAVQSANRALDAQLRHLRQLFDQAPGFLCVLRGPEHVYELVNQAYYAVAGRREIVGRPIREALPELAGQGYIELLDRVYATGHPYVGHGARVLLKRDDSAEPAERYVDFIYQPLIEDDSTITGVLVQGHDVTEQVTARQAAERYRLQLEGVLRERTQALEASITGHAETRAQLLHMQKLEALGRLTGGVAHDFNNLLQVISNSLLILQGVGDGDPEIERWIGVARHAVRSGANLTAQLLAFARRQPLSPRSVNIRHLLQGMSDLIRRAIGEAIEVTVDFAPGLWNIYADPHQLENVILNLSLNARDAIGERGRLMLAAGNGVFAPDEADGPTGDCVWLSVFDTGHGMGPEVLARAFEPFFTTKPEGRGTGLGLSMVYGFVRQSGGQIAIDSAPGMGTTVTVRLPRARESEELRAPEALGPAPGGRETLLVVEDDEAVRASTSAALGELGYRVLTAPDAASALRVLQRDDPVDLLFTDVVMPGPLNAAQLAQQARQLRPGLQVLFTSGYVDDRMGHGGGIDPALPLIAKPYERDDLARRIRQLLDVEPAPPSGWSEADLQLSVLFVDDDEDLQYVGAEVLRMMGNEVQTAASAEEALALLRERHFDVLVTDVGLPGMSGIALARLARERVPALKVVLASGYGRSALPDSDQIREHTVLLPKPYTPDAMAQALRRACSEG